MKNEYCVHCGRYLSASIRFGDTFLCNDCVPRCSECGISFRHTNRKGEVCEFCAENYLKRKDVCASCGISIKIDAEYYKRYGNYCIKCNCTFDQIAKVRQKYTTEDILNDTFKNLFSK